MSQKKILRKVYRKSFVFTLFIHAFYIEHSFGHHVNVGTPKDGATAKYKQSVYSFWITSVSKQYVDAENATQTFKG